VEGGNRYQQCRRSSGAGEVGPDKTAFSSTGNPDFPHSDKTGGLKGSMQHLLKAFL
jgi:hypothetical protein